MSNLDDIMLNNIVEIKAYKTICPNCGYKNHPENIAYFCPKCGKDLKLFKLNKDT